MRSLRPLLLCAALIAPTAAYAQTAKPIRVLPADFNANKSKQMMRSYLRERVHAALDRRLAKFEAALESEQKLLVYQENAREFLGYAFGRMPERTPLKPVVTGTLRADAFRIDKVMFESRPGFHVTASLYRPHGDGPFPAILHPCGHSENGKAAKAYQLASQLLCRTGFIVLCYDPIGQGERKQIFQTDGKPAFRGSSEHQQLGAAPLLLGQSLAGYMVWDGMRAIDYLCSRADVDATRIGCMGNSGGGNMTSYLMAHDPRILAAAPGCFITTHRRKNESPGPGDAEQNLHSQIRYGFDHADFIITRAPHPTLILAATHDFVPIEGTWEAYRQAKRAYARLGHPERVDLIEANAKHGFTRRLREGAARFFARWLQNRRVDVVEGEAAVRSDAELQVTPEGQVSRLPGERSVFDINAALETQLAAERPRELTVEQVRRVSQIRPLSDLPSPRIERLAGDDSPQRIVLHPEKGIVLPALYWPGEGTPTLIAHDRGMTEAISEAETLHRKGQSVLLVDVRDVGETRTRNWRFFGADYYIAYMLDKSWLGMQAEDLLVSARWLAKESQAESVRLVAHGQLVPAAMHAAALEPDLVESLRSEGGLNAWRDLMRAKNAHQHLHCIAPGALRHYDLPDLSGLPTNTRR